MEDRLAVVVHELRSPVAALVAIADAFGADAGALDPLHARRLLALAADACRSIDRLLSDDDVFSVVPREVELDPFLADLASGRAELDVEPGLTARVDPVRLRQAITNLLDNAERHAGVVHVGAASEGDRVVISVSDDGPGVPEGLEVFASGVSGAGSSGYGLAVVRRIAERHGGRVELESGPSGTTFRLVLPRVVD